MKARKVFYKCMHLMHNISFIGEQFMAKIMECSNSDVEDLDQ